MKKVLILIILFDLFLFSCQEKTEKSNIEDKQKASTIQKEKEKSIIIKSQKNTIQKEIIEEEVSEKIKIDTTIWLKDEALVFKEISKFEFEQKYRSSNPSDLLYIGNLQYFKRKNINNSYTAYSDYSHFVMQQNLIKDSSKVKLQVYKVDNGHKIMVNQAIFTFNLENGKEIKLIDNPRFGEASKSYSYRETLNLNKVSFFVYRQYNWEGVNYGLINTKTGEETYINGVPQISPNKRYILTTPYDAGTYFNYNGIMLFDCHDGYAKLKWKFNLSFMQKNPSRVCWLDNQTILCELIRYGSGQQESDYCIIKIKPYQKN